ncbi:hypothetical protein OROMI_030414 [Orobanche minor]
MAHVVRPLIQWPRWRHPHSAISRIVSFHPSPTRAAANAPFITFFSNSFRQVHFRPRAIKSRDVNSLADGSDSDDESSDVGGMKKSRNEMKREARRAVRWVPSKLLILCHRCVRRVAGLEQEVFDALMVVKKLGRDVREGKRRQFNYIGRLLREAEPELMDALIQAAKDGDQSKFQKFLGTELFNVDDKKEEKEEIAEEDEKEDSTNINVVTRWYNGLINKDISITNEIYSLREVEFNRQELRQLVRKVHLTLEQEARVEENGKPTAAAANVRRSLTLFLHGLARQLPAE